MRRIDLLISEARDETDNKTFTDSTGIQDGQFLRWANSAQERLLSLIQQAHPDIFEKEKLIDAVIGQETYTIPPDAYLGTRIVMIEFSKTGDSRNFFPLRKGYLHERVGSNNGSPLGYIRRSGQFLVQPPPDSSGKFRVTFQYVLPRVDIKRAVVGSVTLDNVTNTITTLNFDTALEIEDVAMKAEQYITIVDKDGAIKMRAIPVNDVNVDTGLVTVDPSFVFDSGETISVGDIAVLGKFSTTHSQLVDTAERYLVEFMIWKSQKRDANSQSVEMSQEMLSMEAEIIGAFSLADDDVMGIPIINTEFLDTEFWW